MMINKFFFKFYSSTFVDRDGNSFINNNKVGRFYFSSLNNSNLNSDTSKSLFNLKSNMNKFIDGNDDINIKYLSKNKLDHKNISKVLDYLNNDNNLNENKSILNDMKLLESRIKSDKFLPNYVLMESINNINYMEDDFILNFYDEIYNEKKEGSQNVILDNNNSNLKIFFEYKLIFENLLKRLDNNRVYKCIFRWQSIENDNFGNNRSSFNTSHSFFIYFNMDINIVLFKFIINLNIITEKYNVSNNINLDIFIKEWLSVGEFKSFDKIMEVIKKSDNKFLTEKVMKANDNNILDNNGYFKNDLINNKRKFNLCLNVKANNYGNLINKEEINKFDLFKKLNIDKDFNKINLYKIQIKNKNYILKVENIDKNVNKVIVYLANMIYKDFNHINENYFLELESWTDTISYKYDDELKKDLIIVDRVSDKIGYIIKFINEDLNKVDVIYNSKKLLAAYSDYDKDFNFGTIDIETFNNSDGDAVPYSIGFKTKEDIYISYMDDFNNSDEMILDCMEKILINKNHNIKLYAHNMSEFDGILILKSLINTSDLHNYKINIYTNNDGKIISIDITKKIKNKKIIKISILDSCLLLPIKLSDLAKVFKTDRTKGIFPYDFISEKTLKYKGNVPNYKYFNSLSYDDYLNYVKFYNNTIWNTKTETLKYLEIDLILLYEIISKFNILIFDKFKINITRVRTLTGLAFLIYNSKYYDYKNKPIYFCKGKLDTFIRKGYMGGIVDVNIKYTDFLTFKYDVNSHYPHAMLQPMPGGLPRISNEKNLDNIFGFVEAIVEAPNEKELPVAILPVKINNKTILFRNTVKGVWWSEELKMAKTYGYKIIEILSCVQFDKEENTFKDYITEIYKFKIEAEMNNNIEHRYIYKLLLNTFYGRMAIRNKQFNLSVITEDKLEKLLYTENAEVLFKSNNLNLIKSSGPLNTELIKIINDEKLYGDRVLDLNAKEQWGSNKSAVQYSAAITAYARMYLNQFKNMKDNPYLGGDTDSIIMTKPLDKKFIGKDLGKFKLEYVIQEGFYHSKKFYLLHTIDNKIIIKAKGIDNSNNSLNYNSFVELFKGNTIKVKQIQFNKNLKTLNINIKYIEKKIKGIIDFKINYQMKNRNIILYNSKSHSLVPIYNNKTHSLVPI